MEGEITSLQKLWRYAMTREANSRNSKIKYEPDEPSSEFTLLWNKIRAIVLSGSSSRDTTPLKDSDIKAKLPSLFPALCKLLSLLVRAEQERIDPSNKDLVKVVLCSAQFYFEEALHCVETGGKPEVQQRLGKSLKALSDLNEVFIALLKHKNPFVLKEKQVTMLNDCVGAVMTFIQNHLLLNSLKNIVDSALILSEAEAGRREHIATLIFHTFKLLIATFAFADSPKKQLAMFERFKLLFTLMAKSEALCKIANEPHSFGNSQWEGTSKQVLRCCGVKWLSVFVQDRKVKGGSITLKYFAIHLLYQMARFLRAPLNEELLSIFAEMIYENKTMLFDLVLKRGSPFMISLLLNENLNFIKVSIIGSCNLPASLSPAQRQSKYQAMQIFFRDYLYLLIKLAMYVQSDSSSIKEPQDFVATLFKSLNLFKKFTHKKQTPKIMKEIENTVCLLVDEVSSMRMTSQNNLWIYKIYWTELLLSFDHLLLADGKHRTELESIVRESANPAEHEGLKRRTHSLALAAYVRTLQSEPVHSLRKVVSGVTVQHAKDCFYVVMCLLCCKLPSAEASEKKPFTLNDFDSLLLDESKAWSVLGGVSVQPEMVSGLNSGIFKPLYQFHDTSLESYMDFVSENKTTVIEENELAEMGTHSLTIWGEKGYSVDRQTLNLIESFIVIAHYITPVAKQFIANLATCKEICLRSLKYKQGRNYLLRLLDVICIKLRESIYGEMENFVELHIHIISSFTSNFAFEEEKAFVLHLMNNLELLIIDEKTKKEAKQIIFIRSVITLLAELYKRKEYSLDREFFMRYMEFFALTAMDNPLFYDYNENKRIIFEFIIEHTVELTEASIMRIEDTGEVLNKLVEIGFNKKFTKPTSALIMEIASIESVYKILYLLFKSSGRYSKLVAHMIQPLEIAYNSLANYRLLSQSVSEYLISLSKWVESKELRMKVYEYVGMVGAVNSTTRFVLKVMRNLAKRQEMTDALINLIVGYTVADIFHFTGARKSFVKLKCDSVYKLDGEFCFVGKVRVESGAINKRMCIWSSLYLAQGECRGVELNCIDRKPIIHIIKKNSVEIDGTVKIKNAEFAENTWHSIVISINQRKLMAYFDESFVERDFTRNMLPKTYTSITIGASPSLKPGKPNNHFTGEMSSLYFLNYTESFAKCLKEIAANVSDVDKLFVNKHVLQDNSEIYDTPQLKARGFYNLEIITSVIYKNFAFSKDKQGPVDALNETQVFLNRPARDIFHNLGGFKACMCLLPSSLSSSPSQRYLCTHSSLQTCTNILRLLFTLLQNDDKSTLALLVESNGLLVLRRLLEKVGKSVGFDREFVYLLVSTMSIGSVQNEALIEAMLTCVMFNWEIWRSSRSEVITYLLQSACEFVIDKEKTSESVFNCVLNTFYGYFYSREDPSEEISRQFEEFVLSFLSAYGKDVHVNVVASYLRSANTVALHKLIKVIATCQYDASCCIFENYVRNCISSKSGKCPFISALLALLSSDLNVKENQHIIAYAIHILLSFRWRELLGAKAGRQWSGSARSSLQSHGSIIPLLSFAVNNTPSHYSVFLTLLFKNKNCALSLCTYHCLMSYVLEQPVLYIKDLKTIKKSISEFRGAKANEFISNQIYIEMAKNLYAFDAKAQPKVLKQLREFFKSDSFAEAFVEMDEVFKSLMKILIGQDIKQKAMYLSAEQEIFSIFIKSNWQNPSKQPLLCASLYRLAAKNPFQYITIMENFVSKALHRPLVHNDVRSAYMLIHLVYSLEDLAMLHCHLLTHRDFLSLLGKVVLLLNELKLLRLWLPQFSFKPSVYENCDYYLRDSVHRKGGVLRIVLRLLFGIILRSFGTKTINDFQKLALKLLWFVIRNKKKDLLAISYLLSIKSKLSSAAKSTDSNLFRASDKDATKEMIAVLKYNNPKGKNLPVVIESFYESKEFKFLFLATNLGQCIVYSALNIRSYSQLGSEAQYVVPKTFGEPVKQLCRIFRKVCKLAGKKIKSYEVVKLIEESEKKPASLPKYSIDRCVSDIEFLPAETIDTLRPNITKNLNAITYRNSGASLHPPAKKVHHSRARTGVSKPSTNPQSANTASKFVNNLLGSVERVMRYVEEYKVMKRNRDGMIAEEILSREYLCIVQAGLHELMSEGHVFMDRIMRNTISTHNKKGGKKAEYGVGEWIRELVRKPPKECASDYCLLLSKRAKRKHKKLLKSVFSEPWFKPSDNESKAIYSIAKKHYKKICSRCPLYNDRQINKIRIADCMDTFVEVSREKDNMGRMVRFKTMKNPLARSSVRSGLKYIVYFFLKRVLVQSISSSKKLLRKRAFLVQDKYLKKMLVKLINERLYKSVWRKHDVDPSRLSARKSAGNLPTTRDLQSSDLETALKTRRSEVAAAEAGSLEADVLRDDESFFGLLRVDADCLSFSRRAKPRDDDKYRFGPSRGMESKRMLKKTEWYYTEMARIIARRYNLIHQAIEITLKNHKSVFIILFSNDNLTLFFNYLLRNSNAVSHVSEIIRNSRKAFDSLNVTRNWLAMNMSTFEYLTLLNDFAGRTLADINQYPVFPWLLQGKSKLCRDLALPIAGISEKKREEALVKYEFAAIAPEEKFQHGSHYLPGRGVLGYLMRLQPFASVLYKFDMGEDLPARKFHYLESMWNRLIKDSSNNYELVPEFFYNPYFLYNLNCMALGSKQVFITDSSPHRQTVQIDAVILPDWARSGHHYIQENYLCLESAETRRTMHKWIDLVFGREQQSAERFNLFKPLTSEEYVREREAAQRLEPGEIAQIAGFGQNPMKLFDEPHKPFKGKSKRSLMDFDETNTHYRYHTELQTNGIYMTRILTNKKNLLYAVANNELFKLTSKCKIQAKLKLHHSYPILSKDVFNGDPLSTFSCADQYLVTCKHPNKSFVLYNLTTFTRVTSIVFHLVIPHGRLERGDGSECLREGRKTLHRRRGWDGGSLEFGQGGEGTAISEGLLREPYECCGQH